MNTRRLDESEFKATIAGRMCDVTKTADEVIDIWPYVEAVPSADYAEHSLLDVELVYRSGDDQFEHVLIATGAKNVYLVIVVNFVQKAIYGHRLLDLNREYGFTENELH